MWLVAAAAFLAVWQTVDVLKSFADVMGPKQRGRGRSSWGSAMDNLVDRAEIVPRDFPERIRVMATDYFPRQRACGRSPPCAPRPRLDVLASVWG
jgi:hypothetical protein